MTCSAATDFVANVILELVHVAVDQPHLPLDLVEFASDGVVVVVRSAAIADDLPTKLTHLVSQSCGRCVVKVLLGALVEHRTQARDLLSEGSEVALHRVGDFVKPAVDSNCVVRIMSSWGSYEPMDLEELGPLAPAPPTCLRLEWKAAPRRLDRARGAFHWTVEVHQDQDRGATCLAKRDCRKRLLVATVSPSVRTCGAQYGPCPP